MKARPTRNAQQALGPAGLVLAALLQAPLAHAQLAACASIHDDRERLACYDALARSEASPQRERTPPADVPAPAAPDRAPAPATALERRWDLRPDLKRGALTLAPYRPLYGLAHATDRTNASPGSPTRALTVENIQLNHVDAKMQLSFKTKLVQDLFATPADLWFGYTQQSYWQAGNVRYSSPFRETDYEPEAILVYPLQREAAGIHARYVALSLTHQSNGRGEALSRSWNRLIGDVTFEREPWSVHVRPWMRVLDASGERDDNPDILDFIGRGEIAAVYRAGDHVVTVTGRHSFRSGDRSRGSARVDWAFPLAGALNGHLQIFSGYGENLIDYNHRQTTVGLGISFAD